MNASVGDALARVSLILPPTHPAVLIVLKVTLLLIVAMAATAGLARASAGARHLVWLTALGGLLLIPVMGRWAPLPLPVLPGASVDGAPAATLSPPTTVALQETPSALDPTPAGGPVVQPATGADAIGIGMILLGLWAIVALVLLVQVAHSAWAVGRVVRRARSLVDPAWQTPLYEIADRLGLDVAPPLLQSDDVRMPFAAGMFAPVIVLPSESEGWSHDRRSAVLIHELGHVRRRDLIGHTLSRVACALYWFHPMVWTAARRLRAESERACDDLALVFGARPSDYAEHLLDIVTCVRDHRTPAVALAMAHRREFEGRMLAILNPELSRRGPSKRETASVVAGLVGLALLVGAAAPVPRPQVPTPPLAQLPPLRATAPDSVDRSRSVPTQAPKGASRQRTETPTASQDPADRAAALARALRTDSSARVRRTAAWGLHRYADKPVALEALVGAVERDADAAVREMAAWALADAPRNSAATASLAKALREDADARVRQTATWAVGQIGDIAAVPALTTRLGDADPEVREMAAWAIGTCAPGTAPPELLKALSDESAAVRYSVAWALYKIEDPSATTALDNAFRRESDHDVQLAVIRALGAMGDGAVDALEKLVTASDPEIREIAITALAGGNATGPWPRPRPHPRPYP